MPSPKAHRTVEVVTLDHADTKRRRRTRPPWALDVVVAAGITCFLVFATRQIVPSSDDRALDALGYGLIVVAGSSLALCRRRPRVAVGVITVALGSYLLRRYPGGPIFLTGWIALFSLSWQASRRTAIVGATALCAVLILTGTVGEGRAPLLHLVFVGWSAAAVFLGDALRTRRDNSRQLEERARYLERSREEEAGRRVAEDRLQLARDLHDSVAHAMATINVQAGAAAHVFERHPEAAREALTVIQRASADVLDELAAMLRLLRDDGEMAELSPTPGLEQIETLVATTREAHLPVSVELEGPVDAVAKPVGIAAYRIVQESLTNVLRHAGAATAVVSVVAGPDRSLTVEVTDDGSRSGPSTGTGLGIRGMRERAESTGGTLEAGPNAGGGFTVRATWRGRA
jgi:signal transduction histidine kinase